MNQAWPTKRLADVCQILGGATPSKKNPKFYGGDIPWATVGDMNVEVITTTEEYITKAAVADCSTNVIPSGSIVMATRVGLGKVCVLGQDTAINQDLKGLTPKNPKELTNRWLYWWLKSMASDIQKAGTGATVQGVKMTFVQELEIPLPPLAEQKRIVALLDEAFAGIDEAKVKTEDCASKVNKFHGEVVRSKFEELSRGKETFALGDICEFVRGPFGGSLKKSIFVPEGYAVYEQQHAIYDQFNEIRYFVSASKFREMKRFELAPGDLIMSCSGTMGRVAIVPDKIMPGIINQALLKLTPGKKIQAMFLKCWMESESFQDALKKYAGGAAIQNVASVKILKGITIPLPSLTEQIHLIETINSLQKEVREAAQVFEKKTDALNELKKSLLSQAFAGELAA